MDLWKGERVRLRGVEPDDAETFFAWNRDSEMARRVDFPWLPLSLTAVQAWAAQAAERPEDHTFTFVIENEEGDFVGTLNTHHCDPRVGTFSYGVAIRRSYRRRGYASEAILLALRYYFQELRYQKVTVQIYENNPGSVKLHESLGFTREGRLRRAAFTAGEYLDVFVYGMTVEEFRARHHL
jgi:RimJ/RimL family protein N-acetyltransferase